MVHVRSQAPRSAFFVLPVAPLAPTPVLYAPNPLFAIPQQADPARCGTDGLWFAGKCRPCLVHLFAPSRSGKPGFSRSWEPSAVG